MLFSFINKRMIKPFNAYAEGGRKPFLLNNTYALSGTNEASTFDSIYSEFTYQMGSDVTFIPRDVNLAENVFGEYLAAGFNKGFAMRLFVEEVEAWAGGGDMYSKFGLQVTDECTLYCNKSTFSNATSGLFPKQGDVFYITKSQKMFQISQVEDEVAPAFYLFGNRAGYKFTCKMFSYNHEKIDQSPTVGLPAAIQALDNLLEDTATTAQVTLEQKELNNNNVKISNIAINTIDNSEEDALA